MEKINRFLNRSTTILIIGLGIGAPVIFWNAVRYSLPMGYAGMYSLMAELILKSGFKLPTEVPFYGPGGVPFAYPPLGLYLLAIMIKVTGKTLVVLRFAPPFLSALALVPLYFLSLEISTSKAAGFAAVLLAATSPALYIPHAWAAGIVRAPAFGFSLLSIYFFVRSEKNFTWRDLIFAGIALGATILTHLSYAVFAALWISVWTIFRPRGKNWVAAFGIALIGGVVALPWISVMLFRYGPTVFWGALRSHGNMDFLSFVGTASLALRRFWIGMEGIWKIQPLAWLAVLGSVILIAKKRPATPAIFLALAFIASDVERFTFTVSFLLAGVAIGETTRFLLSQAGTPKRVIAMGLTTLFILSFTAYFWLKGLDLIDNHAPRIDSTTLNLGQYFQERSETDSSYLALAPQDEAEWMPYLFKRTPIFAQWGSEWLGTYDEETSRMLQARACQNQQSIACLRRLFAETKSRPDYLIALKGQKIFIGEVSTDPDWEFVYENQRYVVWRYAGQ